MEWINNVLGPVLGLIVGWGLNEWSKNIQMSREKRALIGRALSSLLELHHQIRAIENIIQLIIGCFEVAVESETALRQAIQQLLPENDEHVKRYEEAIGQLSESDPVTAFCLSSNAQIPNFLKSIRKIASVDGTPDVEIEFFERQLKEILVPHIERAIRELARLHGNSTQQQVNGLLLSPVEIPDKLNELLLNIRNGK